MNRIIDDELLKEALFNLHNYFIEKRISGLDALLICTEYVVSVNAVTAKHTFDQIKKSVKHEH